MDTRDKLGRFLADRSHPRSLRAKASVLHVSCQDAARRLVNKDTDNWAVQEIAGFLAAAEAFLRQHARDGFNEGARAPSGLDAKADSQPLGPSFLPADPVKPGARGAGRSSAAGPGRPSRG